ncbi:MAG: transporter [Gemmiger sp.]|nr:transporter [Gemmiger sp.]
MKENNCPHHPQESRLHGREEHIKHFLREQTAELAGFMETAVSILVLVALVFSTGPVLRELPDLWTGADNESFQVFLGHALNLVIGIEFIKMLAKHTPGSALEVLLYAIARHMIVGTGTATENLLSLLAIGLIFVIRKFCFVPSFGSTLASGEPAPDCVPAPHEAEDLAYTDPE